jgi:hypothetical protein
MWLATVSATATLIATLSAIATIGGFFAYLYFSQRSDASIAREEALSLAETRREVITDLRDQLAAAEVRHRRMKAKYEKRVQALERALHDARSEARDQAYQAQRRYAIGLVDVLDGIRNDLAAVPPDVDRALERIRNLLARAQPTAR